MNKLIAALNVIVALALAFLVVIAPGKESTPWFVWAVIVAIIALMVVNTVILLRIPGAPSKTRVGRMMGYWMDAKEAELKARADGGATPKGNHSGS